MDSCANCYPALLPANNGLIYVKPGIDNFENYFWKITDKFGSVYTGECTPAYSMSSSFVIDPEAAVFPVNLFDYFSGPFILQVVTAYDIAQTMTFGGTEYGGVELEFYNYIGDDNIQSVIQ